MSLKERCEFMWKVFTRSKVLTPLSGEHMTGTAPDSTLESEVALRGPP